MSNQYDANSLRFILNKVRWNYLFLALYLFDRPFYPLPSITP